MDYEKILKGIVQIINTTEKSDIGFANICTYIGENCPELKESEDERIRKELIQYLKDYPNLPNGHYCRDDFFAWLEKQGKQEQVSEFKADDWYVSKVDGKIHNVYHSNKVEPKFKVGDWVANDYCAGKIIALTDDAYLLDSGQGIPFSCEHNAHLWTIQDAKDGDVLVSRSPFIYGKQYPYGGLNWFNNKFIRASNFIFTDSPVHPATKEQRNTLMKAMADAGYTFDFEKKELKKIEKHSNDRLDPLIDEKIDLWIKENSNIHHDNNNIVGLMRDMAYYVATFTRNLYRQKSKWTKDDEQ